MLFRVFWVFRAASCGSCVSWFCFSAISCESAVSVRCTLRTTKHTKQHETLLLIRVIRENPWPNIFLDLQALSIYFKTLQIPQRGKGDSIGAEELLCDRTDVVERNRVCVSQRLFKRDLPSMDHLRLRK